MRLYDAFFFGAFFFLFGVLAASLPTGQAGAGFGGNVWWLVGGGVLLACAMWRWYPSDSKLGKRWGNGGWLAIAALLFLMPAGAWYYAIDDSAFRGTPLPEGKRVWEGRVVGNPLVKEGTQETVVALAVSEGARVLVRTPAYPSFRHGDALTFEGAVTIPLSLSYRRFLEKERVRGIASFPKLLSHEPSAGITFRGALFTLRARVVEAFRATLPAKEAALMAGLTVGAREDFSEEFRDAMAKSGTTHLVALSGYNISVIALVVMPLLLLVFPHRAAFGATLAVIFAFVLMTGAEASVVRAGVMGGVALLAREAGRMYSIRNAIAFSALIMVLINPKVLAFDLGFQLSFLALIGIVYLKPAFDRFLARGDMPSVFSWRENLATTAAAQLAVAPLLIVSFGSVSLSALLANLVVLEAVPLTMGLGFILAGVSFVSSLAAQALGLVAFVFLKFQTLAIELFAHLAIPVGPALSRTTVFLYYAFLILFVWYTRYHHRRNVSLIA